MAKADANQISGRAAQAPYSVRVTGVRLTSGTKRNFSGTVTIEISSPNDEVVLNLPFAGIARLDDAVENALSSVREWAEKVAQAANEALSGS